MSDEGDMTPIAARSEAGEPLWLSAARGEIGVKEIPGVRAQSRILEYFRASGHGKIISDETAWCAAFVNWALLRAGIRGTMALNARSFLGWGKASEARLGAVCVFSRGNSPWLGHVGFYVGETDSHLRILGGNQSDGVTIANYPKSRLIGVRWPRTVGGSRTIRAAAAGVAGVAGGGVADLLQEFQGVAETAAGYLEWMKYLALVVILVSFGLTVWWKVKDIQREREVDGA